MNGVFSCPQAFRSKPARLPVVAALLAAASVAPALGDSAAADVEGDAPAAADVAAAPQLVVAENDTFSVVGFNWNEARAVERISAELRDVTAGWLALPTRLRQLIVVQLIPPEHYRGEEAYHIEVDDRGGIVVALLWDETLRLESVCEALARAYLIKRLWLFDPTLDPDSIPDWLAFAVGASLEVAWIPGRREALRERAKQQPPLGFADIFNADGPYGETREWVATEAYWLLRFLRREWRRLPDSLWLTVLTGTEPDWVLLAEHSTTPADATMRELWWAVGRADLLLSRAGAVLSLDESREVITRLAYITYEDESGDVRMPASAVLEFDDPAPFAADASDRTRITKLLLVRINPVYHNALISLGFFYEALSEKKFAAAADHYRQFLEDFDDASTLHSAVDELMQP